VIIGAKITAPDKFNALRTAAFIIIIKIIIFIYPPSIILKFYGKIATKNSLDTM
jgi:hypothetical protein